MNRNCITDTNTIGPLTNFLARQNKNQFRLYDDPSSDNWKESKINGKNLEKWQ